MILTQCSLSSVANNHDLGQIQTLLIPSPICIQLGSNTYKKLVPRNTTTAKRDKAGSRTWNGGTCPGWTDDKTSSGMFSNGISDSLGGPRLLILDGFPGSSPPGGCGGKTVASRLVSSGFGVGVVVGVVTAAFSCWVNEGFYYKDDL